MEPRASVAVLVFRPLRRETLLLRRVAAKGGGWQPVTGRVEPADGEGEEAALRAARREVREETGLEATAVLDLGTAAEFTGTDGVRYRERAFAAEVPEDAEAVLGPEHAECAWLPFADARERMTWEENRRALDALTRALDEGWATSARGGEGWAPQDSNL